MDGRSSAPGAPAFPQPAGVTHDSSPRVLVVGFNSRGSRPVRAPFATTPVPSSPLTRGLRESSSFSAAADKRVEEAPQEAPRSGADSGAADSGAATSGHSSGDEQDAPPRMPTLERTLSGSMPVCIPGGDRRR